MDNWMKGSKRHQRLASPQRILPPASALGILLNKGSEGVFPLGGYWGSFAEILRPPELFSQMCRPLISLRRGRCNL